MFIKIGTLKVHYKVSGHGEPILLIHGWGSNLVCFARLEEHLQSKFTVYLLDLPGFGLSTSPVQVWGSNEYADLVAEFIQQMRIINPILVGHSLGGKIIINLVAEEMTAVKKLVLISSSGVQLPKSWQLRSKIYLFKLVKLLMRLPIIGTIFWPYLEKRRRNFGSNDYKNSTGVMRDILVKGVNENVINLLSKIKVPTLLLWGDQDQVTPIAAGRVMREAIVGSQLKILAASGHFPFLDNWEAFIVELDNFIG